MIAESASTKLKVPCWIDAFTEAAEGLGIPKLYVRWAAIFAVASAMGRHTYSMNTRGTTYPNIYVLMVGPPGTGKSEAEDLIRPMLQDIGISMSSQHVTKAALIDELAGAGVRRLLSKTQIEDYHHLAMLTSEWVETFPSYDIHFLGMLSRWWDCPARVKENKRHLKDPIIINNACANMFAGVQPGMLSHSFPTEAWNGGFLARTIFVYVPKRLDVLLRTRPGEHQKFIKRLEPKKYQFFVRQLAIINKNVGGLMDEDESFVDAYLQWRQDDKQEPRPKHPRLQYYNDRREHQLEKLSMISAASRGSMTLTGYDYDRARAWLEETEVDLEDIFVEMSSGDDMELMKDMHSFIARLGKGFNKPIRETLVKRFLTGRVSTQRIDSFIDIASDADFITIHLTPTPGVRMISAKPDSEFINEGASL